MLWDSYPFPEQRECQGNYFQKNKIINNVRRLGYNKKELKRADKGCFKR
jgi:hypothetical protein